MNAEERVPQVDYAAGTGRVRMRSIVFVPGKLLKPHCLRFALGAAASLAMTCVPAFSQGGATDRSVPPDRGGAPAPSASRSTHNFYVRSDAVGDGGVCQSNTQEGACKTIQGAVRSVYANIANANDFDIIINVAAGTYTDPVTVTGRIPGMTSNGLLLIGDPAAPSAVTISVAGHTAVTAQHGAVLRISGFKIETSGSGDGLSATFGSVITIAAKMEFGTVAFSHMAAADNASIFSTGDYTISGSATSHWHAGETGGQIVNGMQSITITGQLNFPAYFAGANKGSITAGGVKFVYAPGASVTGRRFVAHYNGTIDATGQTRSFLPGNVAGAIDNGGVYIGSESDRYDPQVAWKPYTPTATGGSGTFRAAARFKQNGTIMTVVGSVASTSLGTPSANLSVSLPATAVVDTPAFGWNIHSGKTVGGYVVAGNSAVGLQLNDGSFPFSGDGQTLHFEITYEVAP
jgi:hypothetical protein